MENRETPVQTLGRITSMVQGVFDSAIARGEVKSVEEGSRIVAGFQMVGEGLKMLREMESTFERRQAEKVQAIADAKAAEQAASDAAVDEHQARAKVLQMPATVDKPQQ